MENSVDPDQTPICSAWSGATLFAKDYLYQYFGLLWYVYFQNQHFVLTLLLLNMTCPVLANSVDPDQLASEEANWSVSALFFSLNMWISIKNTDQVIWLAGN